MAKQIFMDQNREPEENQEQEDDTLGFRDLGKIIVAIYSLTAPYFIAFILFFALAIALVLGIFLL